MAKGTDDGLEKAEAGGHKAAYPLDKASAQRPRWHGVVAIVLTGSILLAIGLSLGLTRDENHSRDEKDTGNNIDTSGNGTNETVDTYVEDVYNSTTGPLDVTIPLFDSNATQGYSNREELEASLTEVGKFLANNVINRNLGVPGYENVALPWMFDAAFDSPAPDGPVAGESAPGLNTGDAAQDATSYETNNQERGVDEADFVKSDGEFVFAAYGDRLVVWSVVSGNKITELQMPSLEEFDAAEPSSSTTKSVPYYAAANIQSLLLTSNCLVVIMSGYGRVFQQNLGVRPILVHYASMHVRVYDISNLSQAEKAESGLKFLGSKTLNGYFKGGRSIGENIHIVSSTDMDVYYPIIRHLERYQTRFRGLTDEQYLVAAADHAENVVIPAFVEQVIAEITMGGMTPRLARITMWQTDTSGTDAESIIFSNGIITSMAQVTSFNVKDSAYLNEKLAVSVSGVFLPSSWLNVYATEELLVLGGQAWNYSPLRNANIETTYLVGFSLLGNATEPAAVGHVPGYLLNQFSLDHVIRQDKSYLRVATTIRNWWIAQPFIDEDVETTFSIQEEIPRTENQVLILEIPEVIGNAPAVMSEISRIENLGKDGEVFTSLRFMDDIGFAVTFERTDPFYVLNLDVDDPRVLGQIDNITGFSRYMHPINEDNTLIVAVGREATPDGIELGLQITLFDVTDVTMPKDLHRYAVELDMNAFSSSEAEFDHKAFRYISLDTETDYRGVLIIPVSVYNWEDRSGNFDGFSVFSVSAQLGISHLYNVSHSEENFAEGCYYWHQFSGRSMVFDGDLMTIKNHIAKSTELGSGNQMWELKMNCNKY